MAMGFAERLLLRVAVVLVCAADTLAQQEKLEGYCSTGLDPVDENAPTLGTGAICQHMPAGELVNCDTSSGGLSEGSPLGARAEPNRWVASSASIDSAQTEFWYLQRTSPGAYGCTCTGHEYDPETQGYAADLTECPEGNRHAGTVCQDAVTHPALYVDGFFSCICMPGTFAARCRWRDAHCLLHRVQQLL